jgi:pilus assembly protein TadC
VTALLFSLVAAAVLAWPATASTGGIWMARAMVGEVADGNASGGVGSRVHAGSSNRLVPVVEVAGVIDLLALTLGGGAGLVEAMEAVASRVGGPLGLHLRTVAAAGRWGVDDATAWESVPSAWQPAARALRMAAAAGVPPAEVLVRAAAEVRRAEQQRLELATATLGVRIVLPLGLAFLPAFVLTTVVPIVLALANQVLVSQ